ncbi:MAG: hypothetical protein EOO01_31525 [Chitinophagaceae bacterium]|nr:MAG: hypothetical protein EOO01_31525 [Chitinophagaceae bacterium]
MKTLLLITCLLPAFQISFAQDYSSVDKYAGEVGKLDSLNVAQISDTLTRKFADKEQKARAIFYWVANNIEPDLRASKSNDNKKILPEQVVLSRKTTPLGFATLVQEMMSRANIRCLTVDGFIKRNSGDIGNAPDEPNHAWNVVQLGQSADQWYYLDAFLASGSIDTRYTRFIKKFTGEYFFTDRAVFNLQHYPDNSAWLFGPGPKSVKEFFNQPVLYSSGAALGIEQIDPTTGTIKTKARNPVSFSFRINGKTEPQQVYMVTGDERKPDAPVPVRFTYSGGTLSFSHQFKRDDEYPARIVVDGNVVLEYLAIVQE